MTQGPIQPAYDPQAHGTGIVHLGLGAFHKAHQAACTDAALAASGGDWRIIGVSLRSRAAVDALNGQDGRFTLIERGEGGTARIIASIARGLTGADGMGPILAAMTAPECRIVTLTVTEKAYGLDRATGGCDPAHPAVAADLRDPAHPTGVLGLLVRALSVRRAAGTAPFTVLCCDNLPSNGRLLRGAVVDAARRTDPALADWIAAKVAFPSSMVDRITPAATAETWAEAAALTGRPDPAAVETEAFHQWVIEDDFPLGRPDWEAGGAIFVSDVTPYEDMKLRMLNGAHSMLAYAGFHAGHRFVRDVITDPALSRLVLRHLRAAGATLGPLPGIDIDAYTDRLMRRFANPAIAHETFQIAMDGTEKMPQRIFAPALAARAAGQDLRPFAFAAAAWMRHVAGATHDTPPYDLRDPRAAEMRAALGAGGSVAAALSALPGIVPPALAADPAWQAPLREMLEAMLTTPMAEVLHREAAAI
ncbi:mannitol dehydrogenase family protein [Falsirhodobacter algicola]|uniref:Mannitol dehydrogenase family protein n=1 Tax=Falsirhodobacter algicola TaxID=2692330 RepID=A0A8J8MT34_9RHOB|nr:mannitol dehydrogenase family protein [Falsirhodobacter algicola]QUS36225.1 mannitol dehydrogenase family protein [Falsirhodobacter algicola]